MKSLSPRPIQHIRILISSPSDVLDERERARQVVDGLQRRYAKRFVLSSVLWEDLPLRADMSFQEGIDLVLSGHEGIDIAIFILWSRLGSPLGPSIRKEDGSAYRSGTEREFDLMRTARAQSIAGRTSGNASARPDTLVYKRIDENSFHERLRGKSTGEQESMVAQKKLMESFFEENFTDATNGVNTGAYHTFDRPSLFSQRLRKHLQDLLDQKAEGLPREALWDTEEQGPPYMGLEPFRLQHANVFFGREEETLEARRALGEQARNGCAFLLLCGASGSGKSSLACAGVAAAIIENEIDDQIATWRKLVITPQAIAPDPIASFVALLASEAILPEVLDGVAADELADVLRRNPRDACSLRIKPAFRRASSNGSVRLLLIVDQLEELFASAAIAPAHRSAFLEMLEALVLSGDVWVVATVRADFYMQVQTEPCLVRMKSGNGQMDILPPTADALRRLVEEPAYHAGLRFEQLASGQTLSDHILRDAVAHPELLPLVQDLLRELYERRDHNVLTFEAYKSLGASVEGALARRAENAFQELPAEAQEQFDSVLQSVVTLGQIDDESTQVEPSSSFANDEYVVRQHASLNNFPPGTPGRFLIDSFIAKRLFTAGRRAGSGEATVTVSHESLLRVWPRAVDCAQANRDFLRTRANVARRLKEGSPMLEGDPLLLAAKDFLARNPDGFTDDLRVFIVASVAAAEETRRHAERARLRRQRQLYSSLLAIVLIIGALVLYFSLEREQVAIAGQLVAEAEQYLSQWDYPRAEIASAKALTHRDSQETRELLMNARSGGVSFVSSSSEHTPEATFSVFSPDGELAAAVVQARAGERMQVVITAVDERKEAWRVMLPEAAGAIDTMSFSNSANGNRLLAVAWADKEHPSKAAFRAAIWALDSGQTARLFREITPPAGEGCHTKRIPSMAFHPTKPWLATSGKDQRLCLWDYSPSQPQLIWQKEKAHGTAVHGIAFDPTGNVLASGGGDYLVKLWNIARAASTYGSSSHKPTLDTDPMEVMSGHTDSVFVVAFSPRSRLVASGGYDGTVRIWDRALDSTPPEMRASAPKRPITVGTLSGHQGTVLALAFSDDGKLLTSGGKDQTLRLWDVSEGRTVVTVRPDNGEVHSVVAHSFEERLHIGGETGWSVWSVVGRPLASRLWNAGATVQALAFDPTGRLVAAGGNDGRVRIWDLQALRSPRVLEAPLESGEEEAINGIAFSRDGRWIAAAGASGAIHVWDRTEWRKVTPAEGALRHSGGIWGLCFDPQGRWLASSNTDKNNRIRLWKIPEWTLLDESSELEDSVWSLSCEASGDWLVSGDSKSLVAIRETKKGLKVKATTKNVKEGELNVWSVASVSSPRAIYSGNSDGHVRRWSPGAVIWPGSENTSNKETSSEDAKVNPTINSISINQKHGWVAAGGDGASVEIYDMDLTKVRSLRGHGGTIWFVTFDATGARLAYGGTDRLLRVIHLDEMTRIFDGAPENLYKESQQQTGLSVEGGRIVRGSPQR